MARVTAIPVTVNISELRQRQGELLARLPEGPILLIQYSTPAAVLMSVDQWNQLVQDVEDLEDTVTALKAQLALARGESELVGWDEVEADLVPLAA